METPTYTRCSHRTPMAHIVCARLELKYICSFQEFIKLGKKQIS